mmetsp:Transcript_16853/g.31935  ORF Transcript_16853/g.31935 Transcript_16853/m.31935 type:complete len:225 (+) Transcript_16853:213-887(+)
MLSVDGLHSCGCHELHEGHGCQPVVENSMAFFLRPQRLFRFSSCLELVYHQNTSRLEHRLEHFDGLLPVGHVVDHHAAEHEIVVALLDLPLAVAYFLHYVAGAQLSADDAEARLDSGTFNLLLKMTQHAVGDVDSGYMATERRCQGYREVACARTEVQSLAAFAERRNPGCGQEFLHRWHGLGNEVSRVFVVVSLVLIPCILVWIALSSAVRVPVRVRVSVSAF